MKTRSPSRSLATTAATAPAAWTRATLFAKYGLGMGQTSSSRGPRSISAMLPRSASAFTSGAHACPGCAYTIVLKRGVRGREGPKSAG
eukprot:scaffold82388_cov35-Tisochrysis_lutea.AAC.2